MSMLNRWSTWYQNLDVPQSYGDTTSYKLAAEFLAPCSTVADFGCGKGFFKTLRPDAIGIDGTQTPFSDRVLDLAEPFSGSYQGGLLRHVLEHNERWREVLFNVCTAVTDRLCIVLFTPMSTRTHEIARTPGLDVPDMSFNLDDLLRDVFAKTVSHQTLKTNTQYGEETIIRVEFW